jgi:hypothetical protein
LRMDDYEIALSLNRAASEAGSKEMVSEWTGGEKGKPGSLSDLQSAPRAHLAGIEETAHLNDAMIVRIVLGRRNRLWCKKNISC